MLESFSPQAMEIIEKAQIISQGLKQDLTGSEHLLLAMYDTPDAICKFLLEEKKITRDILLEAINKQEVNHLKTDPKVNYTSKFQSLVMDAEGLAHELHGNYVYDEHLFYVMILDKDNVACQVLLSLGLNLNELLLDISDIYNFHFDKKADDNELLYFLINLSKKPLTHPFYERHHYLDKLIYILNKKQKSNPLLIGSPGVGKTMIVHALAKKLEKPIYQLDLGGVMAGTKYRGELEEKLLKALSYVKKADAYLYIDEIHNIVGSGSNDGSFDIANIIKPYLSSGEMGIIGSTTLDEYHRYFEKDLALMRRFQTIFIDEPTKKETLSILNIIKETYESYHGVKYSFDNLKYIVEKTDGFFPNKAFPDKAIDVLDEVGSRYKIDKKYQNINDLIDLVIKDMTGLKMPNVESIRSVKLNYPFLKPFYLNFIEQLKPSNNIFVSQINHDFNFAPLLNDLYKVFNLTKEMILEINLEYYHDDTSLNNLMGSSKGYVGYNEGGILTEHLYKYPISLIIFKNYDLGSPVVKDLINKIINTSFIIDHKGRKISLTSSIFLIDTTTKPLSSVGFLKSIIPSKVNLNLETIKETIPIKYYLNIFNKYKLTITNWETFYLTNHLLVDFDDKMFKIIIKALLIGKKCYEITNKDGEFNLTIINKTKERNPSICLKGK